MPFIPYTEPTSGFIPYTEPPLAKTQEEIDAEKPAFYPKRDKQRPVVATSVPDYAAKTERTWGEFAQDLVAVSGSKGVVNAAAAVQGVFDVFSGGALGEGFAALGGSYKKTDAAILEYMGSDKQKELTKIINGAGEGKGFIDGFVSQMQAISQNPEYIPGAVIESLPSMLLAGGGARKVAQSIYAKSLASSAAAGLSVAEGQAAAAAAVSASANALLWTASAGEGALAGGQIATEAREAGRTWGQYVLPAIVGGAATAVIGRAAGAIPGFGDAETALFTRGIGAGVGAATGSRALTIAKHSFQEGFLEEFNQSVSEQMFGNLAQGRPWNENLGAAGAQGLVVGTAMGGGMGAISSRPLSATESFAKALELDTKDRNFTQAGIEASAIAALSPSQSLVNPYDSTLPSFTGFPPAVISPNGEPPPAIPPTGAPAPAPTGGGNIGRFTPTPSIDGLINAITNTDVSVDAAIEDAALVANVPVIPTPDLLLGGGYEEAKLASGARVFTNEGHTVSFSAAGELMSDRTRLEPHTVTNSYLSEEPLEIRVTSDNLSGTLTAFVRSAADDTPQVIKLSPRANKEYLDGVPIAKVLETEFSDSGGITPAGEKTPHTTTVQRTADAQATETVTPETGPQARSISIDDIAGLVATKNVLTLTELTEKLTGKTQLQELNPVELAAVYDALDKNTYALPLPSYIGQVNQELYKVADVVEAAKTASINFAISDELNDRGMGETPEMAMAQLEAFRAGVASQNGKLLSPNRTGATPNQLLEVWTNYHAVVNDILASRRENPDMWAAYAARQAQVAEMKVGEDVLTPYPSEEHPFGQPVTIVQKFARNWKVREEDGTEGLVPPVALRPANVAAGGEAVVPVGGAVAPAGGEAVVPIGGAVAGGPAAPAGGEAPAGGLINTGGPAAPAGGEAVAGGEAPAGEPTAPVGGPTAPVGGPTAPVGGPTAPVGGPAPVIPVAEGKDRIAAAVTGQPFTATLLRGQGSEVSPYNQLGAQVPILGQGNYTTYDRAYAELFGQNITELAVSLQNPLVISNDSEWRALTARAGWASPNPFGQDVEKTEAGIATLRGQLVADGYDGVIVRVPESEITGKTLQKVFGADQVLEFNVARPVVVGGPAAPAGGPAPTTVDTPITSRQAKARWILDQVEQKITDAVQQTLGGVPHFISGDTVFHYTRNAADPKKLVLSSGFASDAAKAEYEQTKKVAEFNSNPMKMAIEENNAEAVAALLYGNAVEETLWPAVFPAEMLIRIPVNLDKVSDIETALALLKFRITDRSVATTTDDPAYLGPERVTISALYRPAKTDIQDAGAYFGGNRKGKATAPPAPKDPSDKQLDQMLAAVDKDKLFDINSNPANTFGVMMFKEGVVANVMPAIDYLNQVIRNLIRVSDKTGTRQVIKLALTQGFQTNIQTALQQYVDTANALQTVFNDNANVSSLYNALQSTYVLDSSDPNRIKYTAEGIALKSMSVSTKLSAYFSDMYGAFGTDENSTDQSKRVIKKDAEVPPPLGNIIRRGMRDHRQGRDVDTQDFLSTFKFYPGGLNFGDWVNQTERAAFLNAVYDGMYDLADLSGISPAMLGLNQKLKLAIGAQGKGGKTAAHYIPKLNEINLTKTKGDGSLGHEWHHGLDFNLRLTRNGDLLMDDTVSVLRRTLSVDATEANLRAVLKDTANSTDNRNLPPKQAFFNAITTRYFLVNLGRNTAFYSDAIAMDADAKPYWSTATEMLSRSFESMLFDTSKGGTPYLVGPTVADGYISPKNGYAGTTYPEGKERLALNAALTHMLAQIDPDTLEVKTYAVEAKIVYVEGLGYAVIDQNNLNVGYGSEYQIKWHTDESTAEDIKRDFNGGARVYTPYAVQVAEINERVLSMAQRIDAIMDEMNLFKWPEIKNGSMAESMFDHMRQGWWPKNNRELAQYGVKAYTQRPDLLGFNPATDKREIDDYGVAAFLADRTKGKKTQEDFEAAAARFVGQVITDMRSTGSDTKAIYDHIVKLYQTQPTLDVQSTLSKFNNAYSTPLPIGFLAGMLARVLPTTKVLDSTGGNGLLTVAANPQNVIAIEIDPTRANNLTLMQIGRVITGDVLTEIAGIRNQEVDALLINPPFNTLPTPANVMSWDGRSYKISKLEQQIAALSLRALADDGRAVLILAAQLKPGNLTSPDIVFLNWLYGNYNVADHFEIGGNLYGKQGTTYPLRVLVIAGRNQTENVYPANFVVDRVTSFDELWSRYVQANTNSEKIVVGTGKKGPAIGGTNRLPGGVPSSNPPENGTAGQGVGATPGVAVGGQLPAAGGLTSADGTGGRGTSGGLGTVEQQSDSGNDQRGEPGGVGAGGQGDNAVLRNPSGDQLGGLSDVELDDIFAGLDDLVEPATSEGKAKTPRPVVVGGPKTPRVAGEPKTPRVVKFVIPKYLEGLAGLEGLLNDLAAVVNGAAPPKTSRKPKTKLAAEVEAAAAPQLLLTYTPNILGAIDTLARQERQAQEALARIAESVRQNDGLYSLGDDDYANAKPIIQQLWDLIGKTFTDTAQRIREVYKLLLPMGASIKAHLITFVNELKGKTKEKPKNQTPVQSEPIDTEARVVYLGKSKYSSDGIYLPRAQSQHAYTALENLEARVGDVDAFVAKELGYASVEEMAYGPDGKSRLAGYQIDALGLAIYANKLGKGFIIGDDTGVGKGRTAAAMIVWAKVNKKIPIFVTVTDSLYTSMYKDLLDIGYGDIRIGMTNENSAVEQDLGGGESKNIFENTDKNKQGNTLIKHLTTTGALPNNVDAVFTTYSQLNGGTGSGVRQNAIASLVAAGKAVLIMDEAHNAAGVTTVDLEKKSKGQNEFFMSLLTGQGLLGRNSNGDPIDAPDTWSPPPTVYLSATFAKRPDNMPLYIHTNLRYAADTPQELTALFGKGVKTDVLQQVSSEMLVESGSMLRRERSYEGVVMDFVTDVANGPRDAREVDRVTVILRSLVNADRALNEWVKTKEAQTLIITTLGPKGSHIGTVGPLAFEQAKRSVFTSVVHNYIGTLLLSVKTKTAVQTTIDKMNTTYVVRKIGDDEGTVFTSRKEAEQKLAEDGGQYEIDVRGGEKVVIGLQNTNGSALDDYVVKNNVKIGAELPNFGWQTLLARAVDSTRRINLKSATGNDVKVEIPYDLMPPSVRAGYENVANMIAAFQSNLPVSPIDQIRTELEEKFVWTNEDGVTQVGDTPPPNVTARHLVVREITGRSTGIDYRGNVPRYMTLSKESRVTRIFSFQNGDKSKAGPVDVLVINSAGATGISLHASVEAFDQRPRRMIILQPHGDISVFTQLLGRIHRTGQVEWPSFTMLATNIPAEKRILGMLRKKLSSLKSNTSGGSNSTVVEGVDFMNPYGDVATAEYLNEHAEIREFLKQPFFNDPATTAGSDLAHKASGTAALLSTEDQQEYFDSIEASYNAEIELRNATGTNALSRRVLPLEAELFKETIIEEGLDPNNPFLRDVVMAQFNVDIIGTIPTSRNINDAVAQALNGRTADQVVDAIDASLDSLFVETRNQIILKQQTLAAAIASPLATKKDVDLLTQQQLALDVQFAGLAERRERTLRALRSDYAVGNGYASFEMHGVPASAVITGVKVDMARIGNSKTGNPFSPSNFQIIFNRNIPAGRVSPTLATLEGKTITSSGRTTRPPNDQWFALQAATGGRTTRWIALGNILRAASLYGDAGGEIAKFTLIDNPDSVSGVVMPTKYAPPAMGKQSVRLRNFESAVQYVLAAWNARLTAKYAGTQVDEYKETMDKLTPLMLDGVPAFDIATLANDTLLRGPNNAWLLNLSQYRPLGFKLYLSTDTAYRRFATDPRITALVPGGLAKKGKDVFYTMGDKSYVTDPANLIALLKLLHKQYPSMVEANQAAFAREVMRVEFAASEAKTNASFSRGVSRGQSAAAVRSQMVAIPGITVNVVQSATDLPIGGAPTNTEGVWYSGTTVYLVADSLPTARRVQEVLAHEAIGHAAMEAMLGPQLMADLIKNVQALEKMGSRAVKEVAAKVDRTQPGLSAERRAKEIIAVMAEQGLHTKAVVWQRAIQAIRNWLRGLGFTVKFSDRDILAMLRDAETFVGRAAPVEAAGTTPATGLENEPPVASGMTRLYHGSATWGRYEGPAWFSTNRTYAKNYRDNAELQYVDVPTTFVNEKADPDNYGQTPANGFTFNAELDSKLTGPRKPLSMRAVDSLFSVADASAFVSDLVHTDNELNWVKDKFGTPQNIALTSPAFKPVFDEGQAFLTDISRFANMAGDAALSILPRIDRLRDVLPGMLGGVKLAKKEDLSAAMGASMAGTLFGGGSPLKGRVWTDTELRAGGTARTSLLTPFFQSFTPLNDAQIALYRQARASIDISLDNFGKGVFHRLVRGVGITFDRDMALNDIAQVIRNAIQDDITDQQAVVTLASTLVSAKTLSDAQNRITELEKLIQSVTDIENKITDLKTHGYVPAMRFGKYAVYLTETNPATNKVKQVYFGLYESQTSANLAAMRLRKEYPNADPPIRGLLTTKQHEMFQGLSVDVIENFAEYMTDENGVPISKDPLIQGFLRAAVAQRSALKHQIHRKGVAGYSEDIARVLSTFTLSMARNASSNFHFAELDASTNKVPAGDLKDYAIGFVKYLKDPVEEAQAIRAFLFIEYLGGSIINGIINMTQAPFVGLPYLSQFTSSADAAIKITAAATGSVSKLTGAVKVAYERAKIEGVVAPQEIHQLRAESSGTPVGTSIALRKFAAAWGVIYSVTEQFNRTTMFVAAYNIAVEKAMANPYAFAKQAVDQTQFIYNKGNRPVTSRGAIGSVARTFTQFGVSYLELAKRLYNARGTAGSMPFALLVLMLLFAAGAEGLPFVEDVEDILDTIGQWMGFATNTKKSLHRFVRDTVGDTAGQIILKGVSGIPGMPVDLSLRFSMANMIPGTALFKPSEANKAKALIEIVGPAGQFLPVEGTMMGNALNRLSKNDFFGAAVALAPKAVQNVEKGRQMLERGYYPDAKGRRGVDTTPSEAILKMVGAQPASVARQSVITQDLLSSQAIQRREENEIVEQWAVGIAEGNTKEIESARAKMIAWNAANPEYRVVITSNQLRDRIKQLKLPQDVRLIKSAPKEMRREAAEELRR